MPGFTIRCNRRCPGSSPATAASTARSAQPGFGRATCRRSTAISCRSTRIPVSFTASSRANSTSHPKTPIINTQTRRISTSADPIPAGQDDTPDFGTAQPWEPVQQRRQQRPVSRGGPHPVRTELPLQDRELMAQREDLCVFVPAAHRQQPQQREDVRHTEVGQSQEHGRSPCHSVPPCRTNAGRHRTASATSATSAPTSMDEVFGRSRATGGTGAQPSSLPPVPVRAATSPIGADDLLPRSAASRARSTACAASPSGSLLIRDRDIEAPSAASHERANQGLQRSTAHLPRRLACVAA
jgi:hypothetical protein